MLVKILQKNYVASLSRYEVNVFGKSLGGSLGLEVMGDNSCWRDRGFESQRHILDRHDIFHI